MATASVVPRVLKALEQNAKAALDLAQAVDDRPNRLDYAGLPPIAGAIAYVADSIDSVLERPCAFVPRSDAVQRALADGLGVNSADVNALVDAIASGGQCAMAVSLSLVLSIAGADASSPSSDSQSKAVSQATALAIDLGTAVRRFIRAGQDASAQQIALSDIELVAQRSLAGSPVWPAPTSLSQVFIQVVLAIQPQIDGCLTKFSQLPQKGLSPSTASAWTLTLVRLRATWTSMTKAVQISASKPSKLTKER